MKKEDTPESATIIGTSCGLKMVRGVSVVSKPSKFRVHASISGLKLRALEERNESRSTLALWGSWIFPISWMTYHTFDIFLENIDRYFKRVDYIKFIFKCCYFIGYVCITSCRKSMNRFIPVLVLDLFHLDKSSATLSRYSRGDYFGWLRREQNQNSIRVAQKYQPLYSTTPFWSSMWMTAFINVEIFLKLLCQNAKLSCRMRFLFPRPHLGL